MAVESKEVTIGSNDTEYKIQQFKATVGIKHFHKLVKLVGGSLAALLGSDEESDLKDAVKAKDAEAISAEVMQLALEKLIEDLDKVDTAHLCKDLCANVFNAETSQPIKFETEFAGNYGNMLALIKEIIMFNYSSVFENGVLDLDALPIQLAK